jgi:hypothetical protein
LIHLRLSSSTTVSFHLMNPSLFQHVLHSTTWQVKFPLSFLLLTLLKCYYDVSNAPNSMAYVLMVCSLKSGYLVCRLKYAVYGVAQKSLVTRHFSVQLQIAIQFHLAILYGKMKINFYSIHWMVLHKHQRKWAPRKNDFSLT